MTEEYTQRTAHLFEQCIDYFNNNTIKQEGCHIWEGPYINPSNGRAKTPRMKVQINKIRPNVAVHIFAYNFMHYPDTKSPLCHSKGDEIRRDCNNLSCVNPKHMILGNRTETIAAMKRRGTTQSGNQYAKKHSHKDIRKDYYENEFTYTELMEKYNISSKGTISHIINKAIDARGKRNDN